MDDRRNSTELEKNGGGLERWLIARGKHEIDDLRALFSSSRLQNRLKQSTMFMLMFIYVRKMMIKIII